MKCYAYAYLYYGIYMSTSWSGVMNNDVNPALEERAG